MKQKYKNEILMESIGFEKHEIPPFKGNVDKGEKELRLHDVLMGWMLMQQMFANNPEGFMKIYLDKESMNESTDVNGIEQDVKKIRISTKKLDHAEKFAAIKEMKQSKQQIKAAMNVGGSDDYTARAMVGLMMCKYDRKIRQLKEAIKNNEPDDDDMMDELNEDDDVYSYPDAMAKRLLFEHKMLPWEEGAEKVLCKMNGW